MTLPAFIETPSMPDSVGWGSTGGPGFKTEVFTSASGFEQRNMLWSTARCEYNVATGIREKADMDELLAFFYLVRGRAVGFRFRDHGDFELVNEQIGTGNSVQTQFPLIKTYSAAAGANAYVRQITKPVAGSLSLTVNAVPLVENADFAVDYTTGIVTFVTAPAAQPIRVSCIFDVPCRFDTDKLPRTYDEFQIMSAQINIVELKSAA